MGDTKFWQASRFCLRFVILQVDLLRLLYEVAKLAMRYIDEVKYRANGKNWKKKKKKEINLVKK